MCVPTSESSITRYDLHTTIKNTFLDRIRAVNGIYSRGFRRSYLNLLYAVLDSIHHGLRSGASADDLLKLLDSSTPCINSLFDYLDNFDPSYESVAECHEWLSEVRASLTELQDIEIS